MFSVRKLYLFIGIDHYIENLCTDAYLYPANMGEKSNIPKPISSYAVKLVRKIQFLFLPASID